MENELEPTPNKIDIWAMEKIEDLLAEAVDNLVWQFSAQVSEVAALREEE